MRLYIKARIKTKEGLEFVGYVVNEDAYCLSVFAAHDEFTFSRNSIILDLSHKSLDQLRLAIDRPNDEVFPVEYTTNVLNNNGDLIAGVFDIRPKRHSS